MKSFAIKVGTFLRLLDDKNRLSLTNLAVMLALYKFFTSANAIAPLDFGALLTTLLAYSAKKVIEKP